MQCGTCRHRRCRRRREVLSSPTPAPSSFGRMLALNGRIAEPRSGYPPPTVDALIRHAPLRFLRGISYANAPACRGCYAPTEVVRSASESLLRSLCYSRFDAQHASLVARAAPGDYGRSLQDQHVRRHGRLPLVGRHRDGRSAHEPDSLRGHDCCSAGRRTGLPCHLLVPEFGAGAGRAGAPLPLESLRRVPGGRPRLFAA